MNIDNKELLNNIKIQPLIDTLRLEDIDDETYFRDYRKDYISNSRLGKLVKEGVKAFFENAPSPYNPSFEFGTLCHQQVLQPESFEVVEGVYKPTAKAGLMADALYSSNGTTPTDDEIKSMSYKIGYYKDKLTTNRLLEFRLKAEPYWRDRFIYEQKNPLGDKQRVYTDEKSYKILCGCLKSLNENGEVQKLLHPEGLVESPIIGNEKTILLDVEIKIPDYEPRIYKLKAKLDNFSIDTEEGIITVNDLKTTSRPVDQFNITFFGYQRELSFYSYLLKQIAKKYYNLENPKIKGNFLVVSTIPEYTSQVCPMTSKLFMTGMAEISYLLKTVAYFNQVKGYDF